MNFRQSKNVQAAVESILVGSGNQAMASGSLFSTTNSLNIAANQIGGLNLHDAASIAKYNFLGTEAATDVSAIQLVQGTSNSSNLRAVNAYKVNEPAYLKSGVINAHKVLKVTTKLPQIPQYAMHYSTGFTAPVEGTVYQLIVNLESQKRDIAFSSRKVDQVVETASVPVGTTNDLAYWLRRVVSKLNFNSQEVTGNRPFVAFGVNNGGGGGTVLGTLTAGTSFNYMIHNGVTYSYTADTTFINSLNKAIAANAALATATVEVIDTGSLDTAGVDSVLVVGFDEPRMLAYDETMLEKVRIEVATDLGRTSSETVSKPVDTSSSGRIWQMQWARRVAPWIHSLQNHNMTGYHFHHQFDSSNIPSPVNIDEAYYTSTTIEFLGEDDAITGPHQHPQMVHILLAASITNPAAAATVAYVIATTDAATVTSLNTNLGAWLSSASNAYNRIGYGGDATQAAPFV